MAQVIWTATAVADLREIVEYVARRSPLNAERLRLRLVKGPRRLELFPEIGSRVPEFGEPEHVREIYVKPFRILYLIRGDVCHVAHLVHGSRDLRSLFSLEDIESLEE